MYSFVTSPNFRAQSSIIAPQKAPKSQQEIVKEKIKKDAELAKQKDISERNIGEHFTIGMDTVNNIVDNIPVVHATNSSNLNYLA